METLQEELLGGLNPRNFTIAQIDAIKKWKKANVFTIMLEETQGEVSASRHFRTLTWGSKAKDPVRLAKSPKQVFDEEIQNLYDIYQEDGLLTPQVEAEILKFKKVMQYQFGPLFSLAGRTTLSHGTVSSPDIVRKQCKYLIFSIL